MQVRLLTAPFVLATTTAAETAAPSSAAEPAAPQPNQAELVAAVLPAPTVPVPAQPSVAPAGISPPVPAFGLVVPGGDRDDDYFSRAMLSLAPSPIDTVLIDYPAIENDSGHHVSELTLFIDETGRVARVRVDGATLPPALAEAARRAFGDAKFRPGEAEGRPVKSQIRIEVVFDNRPLARP